MILLPGLTDSSRSWSLAMAASLRTGRPTPDAFQTAYPEQLRRIVTEPGAARILSRR